MIISKKQAKYLQYVARANYGATYTNVESARGKVKHREYPCFELSYDEFKTPDGSIELSSIIVSGEPFDGSYDDLMTRMQSVGVVHTSGESAKDSNKIKDSEFVKNVENVVNDVLPQNVNVKSISVTNTDDGVVKVDVDAFVNVEARAITLQGVVVSSDSNDVYQSSVTCDEDMVAAGNGVSHGSKDVPIVQDAEIVAPSTGSVPSVSESKETPAQEDSNAPGVSAESVELSMESEPKKEKKLLTRWELNGLRIQCATMKLARMYGEPDDASVADIVSNHPDSVETLNTLYATDKIKPFTVSAEAIAEAYPDEYKTIMEKS